MRPTKTSARTKQKHWEIQKVTNRSTDLGKKGTQEGIKVTNTSKHTLEPQKTSSPGRTANPFSPKILGSSGHFEADALCVFGTCFCTVLSALLGPKWPKVEPKGSPKGT